MWSKTQQNQPGAWKKCIISGPIPDLWNGIPQWTMSQVIFIHRKVEKHHYRLASGCPTGLAGKKKKTRVRISLTLHEHTQPHVDQYCSAVMVPRWGTEVMEVKRPSQTIHRKKVGTPLGPEPLLHELCICWLVIQSDHDRSTDRKTTKMSPFHWGRKQKLQRKEIKAHKVNLIVLYL